MLQKGFTLIELMIVVAIIGILSMFALPAYQDYTKRTYVSEGMALASAAKMQITEGFASSGRWVDTNDAAGLQAPDTISGSGVAGIGVGAGSVFTKTPATATEPAKYVTQANVNASAIFIYYNDKVVGTTGTLTAGATPTDGSTGAVAAANSVTLSPVTSNTAASIEWICSAAGTAGTGTGGANNTASATQEVLSKWLPSNCRDGIVNAS